MRQMIRLAVKEIKHSARDKKSFIMMILFPLVLMGVLGTALTGAFNTDSSPIDVNVIYETETDGTLPSAFEDFTDDIDNEGIHFQALDPDRDAEKEVDSGKADGYVYVGNEGMDLYLQNEGSLESNVLKSVLDSFADTYTVANEIIQTTPEKADILESPPGDDYIDERAINSDQSVGSMDYYAIVITTMFIFIGAIIASGLIADEHVLNTDIRLMVAPIRKRDILIGKVGGVVGVLGLITLILVLFSIFVYDAYWGEHIGWVAVVLFSEVIFAICFGMGISYTLQSSGRANMIIMIIVQVSAFFGGAFFPIDGAEGILKFISRLSPLEWQNHTLLTLIHADELTHVLPTILLNVGIGGLFLFVPLFLFRKREGVL